MLANRPPGSPPSRTPGEAAVDTVIRLARPGATLGEVAEEAWHCIEPVADGLFLTGAFGYPMGIGFPPLWLEDVDFFIRRGRTEVFEAGMTFHVAVALRGYGAFGVNQSQSMVVTDAGGERLTTTSPRLRIVPA
jgi:Xaa-Pro aminopeptidase